MSLKTLVGSGSGIKKKKFGSGSGINHSGSATLHESTIFLNLRTGTFPPKLETYSKDLRNTGSK